MKPRARNRFSGKAVALLRADAGQEIVAIVTNESAKCLGLTAGRAAAALSKASSVILAVARTPPRLGLSRD